MIVSTRRGVHEKTMQTGVMPPAASPPPPSSWRTRRPDQFEGSDWKIAWSEARAEAAENNQVYKAVRNYGSVLTGEPSSAIYWADGILPKPQRWRNEGRMEWVSCPGQPELRTRGNREATPACAAWWPAGRTVTYVIGVGDEYRFVIEAARSGPVHGYDPTVRLRERHKTQMEKLGPNVTFHYMGLGSARTVNDVNDDSNAIRTEQRADSFGAIDGSKLATFAELAASNPSGERAADVAVIDCEGCEWEALAQVRGDAEGLALLGGVKLLYLDIHLSPTMLPPTPKQFASTFDLLFNRLGFRLRWLRSVDGYPVDQKVADFLGFAGVPAGFCCYEMVLQRIAQNGTAKTVLPRPRGRGRRSVAT